MAGSQLLLLRVCVCVCVRACVRARVRRTNKLWSDNMQARQQRLVLDEDIALQGTRLDAQATAVVRSSLSAGRMISDFGCAVRLFQHSEGQRVWQHALISDF